LFQSPRGTLDILPEDQAYWRYVEHKAAEIAQIYGYKAIETPVFEDTRLFTRSVGEETDIVQKEMYSFEDRAATA
jgi:histidyl-tRNA synthetase